MELFGKIKVINQTQEVSASFKKREIVVTTNEQYPQEISIEFQQDKTEVLNNYKVGDDVKVSINLRGRMWTSPQGEDKYFNTIVGWRIEKQNSSTQPTQQSEQFATTTEFKEEEHLDLPF